MHGQISALLGMAHWANGDLGAAYDAIDICKQAFLRAEKISFAISTTYALADIRMVQGRLLDAIGEYRNSLQLVTTRKDKLVPIGMAEVHLGLSELLHEQGDSSKAGRHMATSQELSEHAGLPNWPHRVRLVKARMKRARGDLEGALELLDEAESFFYPNPAPDICPLAAMRARLWLSQGRLDEVENWVRDRGLSIDDELSFLSEFEHITLARFLIVEKRSEVEGFLERLLEAAEENGRTSRTIEILVLQALYHEAQEDLSSALASLERALELAEPEGFVRIFVDEGAPMARLLSVAAAREIQPRYVTKLLGAFEPESPDVEVEPPTVSEESAQPLIEPLSKRELEEHGVAPLAGGIAQQGYQCGMMWGTTLAAGAKAQLASWFRCAVAGETGSNALPRMFWPLPMFALAAVGPDHS